MVEVQEWEADAVRLKEEGKESAEIAEIIGKHPATVRKAIKRARDRVLSSAEASEAFDGPIPGQTTVDDHLPPSEEPPPGDDPEYEPPSEDEIRERQDAAISVLVREAGEATGPLQTRPGEEPEGEVEEPYVPPAPAIQGTAQLALDFGPNAAMVTSATITFKSEKLTSGYFEMGDVVSGRFTARITGIQGAEKFDKDIDAFVAKPQAQTATITEIEID